MQREDEWKEKRTSKNYKTIMKQIQYGAENYAHLFNRLSKVGDKIK